MQEGIQLITATDQLNGVHLRRHVNDLTAINLGHPHHFITRRARTAPRPKKAVKETAKARSLPESSS